MKVDILFIMLGLFLGVFIVYVTTPPPRVVLKYPTIDNINNTTYVDNNGQCFRYYAREIPCRINPPAKQPLLGNPSQQPVLNNPNQRPTLPSDMITTISL